MAETVKSTGVSKESGYLYYLGKDGNGWRSKMARAVRVAAMQNMSHMLV